MTASLLAAERNLPKDVLKRASLRGNEFAWRVQDIPDVIDAAHRADMVNLGGQLQFRLPSGTTCECYWVEIGTEEFAPSDLPWEERVSRSAQAALAEFERLPSRFDFLAEGRKAFEPHFAEAEASGVDVAGTMWFVWYFLDRERKPSDGQS